MTIRFTSDTRFGLRTRVWSGRYPHRSLTDMQNIVGIEQDLKANRFESALIKINVILALKPDIAELYHYRAVANYHLNNLVEAFINTRISELRNSQIHIIIDSYSDQFLKISPLKIFAAMCAEENINNKLLLLKSCFDSTQLYSNIFSTHHYQQKIVTELVSTLKQRAVSNIKARQPKEALADLNLAIRYNPSFAILYYYRASVHTILGDSKAAAADFNTLKLLDQSLRARQTLPADAAVIDMAPVAADTDTPAIPKSFMYQTRLFPSIDYMIEAKPTEDSKAAILFTKK